MKKDLPLRCLLAGLLLAITTALFAQPRIEVPPSDKYISTVGNDRYFLADDDSYLLMERSSAPSLLFDVESGKLVASGAEAYRLYYGHSSAPLGLGYTSLTTEKELAVYQDGRKVKSIKLDRYKNEASLIRNTGIIVERKFRNNEVTVHHPDGRKVTLDDRYSNIDKKEARSKVDGGSLYSNLSVGYVLITPDGRYAMDKDGRLANLTTGEMQRTAFKSNVAGGYVMGSYDPQTTVLKLNYNGDIQVYKLSTSHFFGTVYYRYYQRNQALGPVVIPLQRSNRQLGIFGLGFNEAQVFLVSADTVSHFFENPYAAQEKRELQRLAEKRQQQEAERRSLEEERLKSWAKNYQAQKTARKCSACDGTGVAGYTEANSSNQMSVYEKRNGNYYFKGYSHNTWPLFCKVCIGKGYVFK